jgi:hypothetical protein
MANSISVAVGERETMRCGCFVIVTLAPLVSVMVTGKWVPAEVDGEVDDVFPHAVKATAVATASPHVM